MPRALPRSGAAEEQLYRRCKMDGSRGSAGGAQWNLFYVFLEVFFWQYLTPPIEQCVEFKWRWMALGCPPTNQWDTRPGPNQARGMPLRTPP